MRPILLFLAFYCLSLSQANAQQEKTQQKQRSYFRIAATYSVPLSGSYFYFSGAPISGTMQEVAGNTNPLVYDVRKASYASGLSAAVAGGIMLTDNIGIDVAASVGLAPRKYRYEQLYQGIYTQRTSYVRTPVLLVPSLLLTKGEKIKVYARLGIVLPLSTRIIFEDSANLYPDKVTKKVEVRNAFTVGVATSVGVSFHLSKACDLWVEANGQFLSLNARYATVTEYIYNGQDVTAALTLEQREAEFTEKFVLNGPSSPGSPSTLGPQTAPFSSLGLSVGAAFRL